MSGAPPYPACSRLRVPTPAAVPESRRTSKAFAACGVYGMTAITAITAQNTVGVSAVHHIPPEMILEQVRMVSSDIGVHAVKIGMPETLETIEAVARALDELPRQTPVVLDPVMVSESGAELLEPSERASLIELLLPRATVVTPNVPEARALTARSGTDPAGAGTDPAGATSDDAESFARDVHAVGSRAVVAAGGHRDRAIDVFIDGQRLGEIPGERYPGGGAHGSGCTHSSVLAARLARGDDPLQAARTAKELASRAVKNGLAWVGAGAGPVACWGWLHWLGKRTIDQ